MKIGAYVETDKLTAEEEATLCGISRYYFSGEKKEEPRIRLVTYLPRPLIEELRRFLKNDLTIFGKSAHAAYAAALYLRWKKKEIVVIERAK